MNGTEQNFPQEGPKRFWEVIEGRSERSAEILRGKFSEALTSTTRRDFETEHAFVPSNITFSPTYTCNLTCEDCYSGGSDSASAKLDDETTDRIILEGTKKWSIPFFTITGGESLLQAMDIAQRNPDVPFQLYTNGTLITEQRAKKIAALGNLFPFVSIEGSEEETDRVRGDGVYKRASRAMDLLTEKGVVWGAAFTLTSSNADVYDDGDFLDTLISRGALLGRFLTYMPTGRNADDKKVPSADQRNKQGDALRRIAEDGRPFYALDYINNPGLVSGCAAAGLRYVHIDPSGNVQPCVFINVPSIFNLKDAYDGVYQDDGLEISSLEDILLRDPLLQVIREVAGVRDQCRCCLVIDDPQEFSDVRLSLAADFPVNDFGTFFKTERGGALLESYLPKLRNGCN